MERSDKHKNKAEEANPKQISLTFQTRCVPIKKFGERKGDLMTYPENLMELLFSTGQKRRGLNPPHVFVMPPEYKITIGSYEQ